MVMYGQGFILIKTVNMDTSGKHIVGQGRNGDLLSFHREMVISKMFLLLLSEEDSRVVAEKVWCCHGYLYLIHGGGGNVIRNFGRKFEHEFEHCSINSAFSPSRKSSKSYRKNDKWKSILFL